MNPKDAAKAYAILDSSKVLSCQEIATLCLMYDELNYTSDCLVRSLKVSSSCARKRLSDLFLRNYIKRSSRGSYQISWNGLKLIDSLFDNQPVS